MDKQGFLEKVNKKFIKVGESKNAFEISRILGNVGELYNLHISEEIHKKLLESKSDGSYKNLIAMVWIDCKVKMPNDEKLIIITDGQTVQNGYYSYEERKIIPGLETKREITHWMRFPKPPIN